MLAIISTLSGLLQPFLELLQSTESMRDLVLLDFVHLGIAIEISFWLGVLMVGLGETYVLPSYSNIGSHPKYDQHCRL